MTSSGPRSQRHEPFFDSSFYWIPGYIIYDLYYKSIGGLVDYLAFLFSKLRPKKRVLIMEIP